MSNSSDGRAARNDEAEAAQLEWELAAADVATRLLHEPDGPHSWGIMLYVADDEPEIQTPAFFWFESRADLFDYVQVNLPLNARRFNRQDPLALREQVEKVLARVQNRGLDHDEALIQLNDLLAPYASIEWWGTFGHLLHGNGEYERDLRRWFRERSGSVDALETELGGLAPIEEGEVEDFAAALVSFGGDPSAIVLPEHGTAPASDGDGGEPDTVPLRDDLTVSDTLSRAWPDPDENR